MNSIARLGFWSALIACATVVGYGVAQIAQIAQIAGALVFPLDEIAIFGFSMLIPVRRSLLALYFRRRGALARR